MKASVPVLLKSLYNFSMTKLFDRKTIMILVAVVVLAVVYGFISGYSTATTPEGMRSAAIEGSIAGCVKSADAAATGSSVTPAQVQQYCTCAMTKLFTSYSVDEMRAVSKDHALMSTPAYQQRLTPIMSSCRVAVLGANPAK